MPVRDSELFTKLLHVLSPALTTCKALTDEKPFKESGHNAVIEIAEGKRPKKPNFVITRGYRAKFSNRSEYDLVPSLSFGVFLVP